MQLYASFICLFIVSNVLIKLFHLKILLCPLSILLDGKQKNTTEKQKHNFELQSDLKETVFIKKDNCRTPLGML